MSRSHNLSVGTIGAGNIAQAVAGDAVAAGHQVKLSNSRGPQSLAELVGWLGANASAGTVAEAVQADIVILAVGWDQVPEAVRDLPDWNGRIVVDATNQWHGRGTEVDLGDETGSGRNAALMPGARVVKALNTLEAAIVAQYSRNTDGRLVVFLAADDAHAKAAVSTFVDSRGFRPSTSADCARDVPCRWAAVRYQGFMSSRSHSGNGGSYPRSGARPEGRRRARRHPRHARGRSSQPAMGFSGHNSSTDSSDRNRPRANCQRSVRSLQLLLSAPGNTNRLVDVVKGRDRRK